MNGIKGYISIREVSYPRFQEQRRDSDRTST